MIEVAKTEMKTTIKILLMISLVFLGDFLASIRKRKVALSMRSDKTGTTREM